MTAQEAITDLSRQAVSPSGFSQVIWPGMPPQLFLFGLLRETMCVQLGFSLSCLFCYHMKETQLCVRGVILHEEVGCLWEQKEFCFFCQISFMMYCVDFVGTQSALFLYLRGTVCIQPCAEKVIILLNYIVLKSCINVGIPELYLVNTPQEDKALRLFITTNVFPGKQRWVAKQRAECVEKLSASLCFGSRSSLTFSAVKHWDLLYIHTCWEQEGFKQMQSGGVSEILWLR